LNRKTFYQHLLDAEKRRENLEPALKLQMPEARSTRAYPTTELLKAYDDMEILGFSEEIVWNLEEDKPEEITVVVLKHKRDGIFTLKAFSKEKEEGSLSFNLTDEKKVLLEGPVISPSNREGPRRRLKGVGSALYNALIEALILQNIINAERPGNKEIIIANSAARQEAWNFFRKIGPMPHTERDLVEFHVRQTRLQASMDRTSKVLKRDAPVPVDIQHEPDEQIYDDLPDLEENLTLETAGSTSLISGTKAVDHTEIRSGGGMYNDLLDREHEEALRDNAKKAAQNFIDEFIIQAFEVKRMYRMRKRPVAGEVKKEQKLIVGIDTGWIPNMGCGLQGLVNKICRLSGLGNIIVVRGTGEALARELKEKADAAGTDYSNIVVLTDESEIKSGAFNNLKSTKTEKKACLIGVIPAKLKGLKDPIKDNYVMILDMMRLALKLAFTDDAELDKVLAELRREYPLIDVDLSDFGPRVFIFIPNAVPFDDTELKQIYANQEEVITAA